jgi:Domain of unknown function (DUF4145)
MVAGRFEKGQKPEVPSRDLIDLIKKDTNSDIDTKRSLVRYIERATAKEIFLDGQHTRYNSPAVINVWLSLCYSCAKMSLWHADDLIYPTQKFEVAPNEDMPEDVRVEFAEASAIVDASARGAAALLRLAIQKLMPHLGEKGKDLNADIGALVRKGLDEKVQKALDSVRVIGNNAVHPGTIDLKDDKETAISLFGLVNYIVESQISAPKQIDAIYGRLPSTAVAAIDKRDNTKSG